MAKIFIQNNRPSCINPDSVHQLHLTSSSFPWFPPPRWQMPASSFHPILDSPPLGKSSQINGGSDSHPSPRPQSAWKSVFRFPNSSSKKLPSNGTTSETKSLFHSPSVYFNVSPVVPPLTPVSNLSDQRSSYNSSNTQSSDSNGVMTSGSPYMTHHKDPYSLYPSPKSTDPPSRSRQHTRSERVRPNPTLSRFKPQTGDTSLSSFPATTPTSPRSRMNGPLNPKSMGATASRFIRRVASAPNAKGLFSIGSRSSPATKNGFLAPAHSISPLPPLISNSMEQGADSLETMSSGSSRGQTSRAINPTPYGALTNGISLPPVPGKTPFRRTYSSNSIKVRKVGHHVIGQLPLSYIIHPRLK
jgi:protein-serine/threonine kinase